jgi:hypothetical protein
MLKALREPQKALFYAWLYLVFLTKRKKPVWVVGKHTRPNLSWKIFRLLGLAEQECVAPVVTYQHIDQTQTSSSDAINGRCTDISKSNVVRIFEQTFGYQLAVDPTRYAGDMVAKSEENAAHDGMVVKGPLSSPVPGLVYQRLLDNTVEGGMVEDLRPCIVGNELPFVYIKRRPVGIRFSNTTYSTSVRSAAEVFSHEEILKILAFAKAIGLDLGEIDILRDKSSGKIFIVDVAKTPHSPGDNCINLTGLSCMHKAAAAFQRQFLKG